MASPKDHRASGGTAEQGLGRSIAQVVVALALLGYFAWVCSEMAAHARHGVGALLAIVVGAALGGTALLLGLIPGRSGQRAGSRRGAAAGKAETRVDGRSEGDGFTDHRKDADGARRPRRQTIDIPRRGDAHSTPSTKTLARAATRRGTRPARDEAAH
jgi:hypothetical protein